MKDFNKLRCELVCLGTALALVPTLAISSNISSTKAAEITITSKVNVSKFSETAPINEVISFTQPFTTKSSSGLFKNLTVNSIANINLTFLYSSLTRDSESRIYIAKVTDIPFISFNDGSRFEIDNPFRVNKYSANNNLELFSTFSGKYINNTSELYKVGLFTINEINNTSSEDNFSLTITNICCTPTPIPETTFTNAVIVFGFFGLRKKLKEKREKRRTSSHSTVFLYPQ
jgi:hypothetical protein